MMPQTSFFDSPAVALARRLDALTDAQYAALAAELFAGDSFRSRAKLFRNDGARKPLWRDQVLLFWTATSRMKESA